eukprot:CAMPEP_0202980470 /NCGR_PEP_ID=MMETSP1396-20130829/86392_1 /ASSEMBLY_ACC=CAM_ASM_000872 /TAXON_ID= /ORGANISM="Pseudokeronopsis sp., Strain Brazil" /LENGTH=77 /DNA_ID=CAMNT_0049720469 /DNA_START=87 /DNA_END=320 /DNA_ORIENTATION=+
MVSEFQNEGQTNIKGNLLGMQKSYNKISSASEQMAGQDVENSIEVEIMRDLEENLGPKMDEIRVLFTNIERRLSSHL